MTRFSYYGAPSIWLAGWIIMRLGGGRGPNAGWMAAHSLWLVAFLLYAVAIVGLTRRLPALGVGTRIGRGAAAVGLIGELAMLGQTVVDLWAASGAVDRAAMSVRSNEFTDHPLWGPLLFFVGPALLYAGILVLIGCLAAARRAPSWLPWLSVAGIAMTLVGRSVDGLRLLEGLGAVVLLVTLVIAGGAGRVGRPNRYAPAAVTSR